MFATSLYSQTFEIQLTTFIVFFLHFKLYLIFYNKCLASKIFEKQRPQGSNVCIKHFKLIFEVVLFSAQQSYSL